MSRSRTSALFLLLIVSALLLLLLFRVRIEPRLVSAAIQSRDGVSYSFKFPLSFSAGLDGATLDLSLRLSSSYPRKFFLAADDCIRSLKINGEEYYRDALPFCDYPSGRTVDLSRYLRPGLNVFKVQVENRLGAGRLVIWPSGEDPLLKGCRLVLVLLLGAACFFMMSLMTKTVRFELLIFFLGSFLRVLYAMGTPYWFRNYDWYGHTDYILYVLRHWEMPSAWACWQCYHPPLYYFVSAFFVELVGWASGLRSVPWFVVQVLSAALSVASLGASFWLGRILLLSKGRKGEYLCYCVIASSFPGSILFSSRINNDLLAQFLAALGLALMFAWWQKGERRLLYLSAVSSGLGLLTKTSVLPVAGALLLCVFLKDASQLKQRLVRVSGILLVFAILAGPFWYLRISRDNWTKVANTQSLDAELKLQNNISSFAVFNPVQVLRTPFVNPRSDSSRREYFFEYLFRTAFFGEFSYAKSKTKLGGSILALGMCVLILAASGVSREAKVQCGFALPGVIAVCVFLVAAVIFRLSNPFSSSQDFRYISSAALLISAFAARSMHMETRLGRFVVSVGIALFVLLSTAFILSVLSEPLSLLDFYR